MDNDQNSLDEIMFQLTNGHGIISILINNNAPFKVDVYTKSPTIQNWGEPQISIGQGNFANPLNQNLLNNM